MVALVTPTRLAAIACITCLGCAAQLPSPPLGPHAPSDVAQHVLRPPPDVVKVEQVPAQPAPDAIWIDGYWNWTGSRWAWRRGSWQLVPRGATYAPASTIRIPVPVYEPSKPGAVHRSKQLKGYGMLLLFIPAHWHRRDGHIIAPIPATAQQAPSE